MLKLLKLCALLFIAVLIVGCGGGGGNASSTTTSKDTSATSTGAANITLSLVNESSATISDNSIDDVGIYYVKAIVKDAGGIAVATKQVSFAVDGAVAVLTPASNLTNSSGLALVQIKPGLSGGTATLTATATVAGASVTSTIDLRSSATTKLPKITLALTDANGVVVASNAISSAAVYYARATVTDATGAPVKNKTVSFSTNTSIAKLIASSGLTDVFGAVKVQIQPAVSNASASGTLIATTSSDSAAINVNLDYQTLASTASANLSLSIVDAVGSVVSNNNIGSLGTYYAKAYLLDSNNRPINNKSVNFSSGSNILLGAPSALSNVDGVAKVVIKPTNSNQSGSGTLAATVTINNAVISDLVDYGIFPENTSPILQMSLRNANGDLIESNTLEGGSKYKLSFLLKSATGSLIANNLLKISSSSGAILFDQSSVITNSQGVATLWIQSNGLFSREAAVINASGVSSGISLATSMDVQTIPATIRATGFSSLSSSIKALKSTLVSLDVTVNGTVPSSGAVSASFSAPCGSFSPSSATNNGQGKITSTFTANTQCLGTVSLTAQATGAQAETTQVNVDAAVARNVLYVVASPKLMVTSVASGAKASLLKFQVVDDSGAGIEGKNVAFSLDSQSSAAGVRFGDGTSNTQVATTDSQGYSFVNIKSGGLPTPVVVLAKLADDATVSAVSTDVAVTAGRPTQGSASLELVNGSLEGLSVVGSKTDVIFYVADRQGNPVPSSEVIFVASHGLIDGRCTLNSRSQCTVTYSTQGEAPSSGRAAILAYLDGEESFVDLNGDNIWQSGESFIDIGTAYRDDNFDGIYQSTEQTYPGGSTGSTGCSSANPDVPFVTNTCDGTWSSNIRVRKITHVVWASNKASISVAASTTPSISRLQLSVGDLRHPTNAMPSGTQVAGAMLGTSTCAVTATNPTSVFAGARSATNHTVYLNGDAGCSGAIVRVTVTTPSGIPSVEDFDIP